MYPSKNDTVELLITAAKRAVEDSSATHPEDIAVAMIDAIECSHPVVLEAFRKFSK